MASAPALPEWKLQLLERKRKDEEEARRREQEQQDRMAKMPAWKREIIERRRAKQGSGASFSEPEGGGAGAASAGPGLPSPQESAVLQEKIGPVHQNPFIQLEKRLKEMVMPEAEPAGPRAKPLAELYSQRPGVRTLQADNVIIIESVPGAAVAAEAKSGSVESLNELLARRGGSVTEIRAGEVFIVKSALSRSVEDLNSFGQGHGEADGRPGHPLQHRGRVSRLLSRFSQEEPPPRPVRSLSTENLADGSYERPPGSRKAAGSARCRDATPSPPRDLPGLAPSPLPFTVASYRSQFEARSEARPESPPRRSPTGRVWGKEAASPERGARRESSSPGGPQSRDANSPDRRAGRGAGTLAAVPGHPGTEAASPEKGSKRDGCAVGPGLRGREAASPEPGARPGGDAVTPNLPATAAAAPEWGARPGGSPVPVGPGLPAAATPEWGARPGGNPVPVGLGLPATAPEPGARLGGATLAVGPGPLAGEAASPERRNGGGGSGVVLPGLPGREAASRDRGSRGEFEAASGPPIDAILDTEAQAKALASLRLHSRNSFVVVPRRAAASPPPDLTEARQETSTSPASISSSCSPSRQPLPLPASPEEPAQGEAMRRGGRGPRELGGPTALPHPAVQRRSGNTITINPRKAPAPAVENGMEGPAAPEKAPGAPVKKRYPTAEEIEVIGGYLSLARSCLAKNDPHRKKLKISFSESQLECTFQYPSEGSLLEEFGPPEELDVPACANPHGEEDEEEEELLLLHRGLPGILRTKALLVDESCRR